MGRAFPVCHESFRVVGSDLCHTRTSNGVHSLFFLDPRNNWNEHHTSSHHPRHLSPNSSIATMLSKKRKISQGPSADSIIAKRFA